MAHVVLCVCVVTLCICIVRSIHICVALFLVFFGLFLLLTDPLLLLDLLRHDRETTEQKNIQNSLKDVGRDKTVTKAFSIGFDERMKRFGGKPSVGAVGQLKCVPHIFEVTSACRTSETVRMNRERICVAILNAWRDIEGTEGNKVMGWGIAMTEGVMNSRPHVMMALRARWEWALDRFDPFGRR